MNEYLLQVAREWRDAEIRPVLRAVPRPRDHQRRTERRTGPRSRRESDSAPQVVATVSDADLLAAAFDKLNRGVLILDGSGRVRYANRSARRILVRRHGITLRHHRLLFADSAATDAYDGLLQRGQGSLVLRIALPAPDCGTYRVLISALDAAAEAEGYCVFIYEADAGHRALPDPVLRNLYGLTAAETRLTNSLFVQGSLQDAATSLGVSINTAKTTLKRVFAKCEVSTQAQLLRLLALGPRTL